MVVIGLTLHLVLLSIYYPLLYNTVQLKMMNDYHLFMSQGKLLFQNNKKIRVVCQTQGTVCFTTELANAQK